MSPPRAARGRRGLTLIELVLTLTVLAIAGALVSGALATSLRAWQAGARAGRDELVARIVLERIAAQLRAVVPSPARMAQEDALAFEAREHALRFVTCAAAGVAPLQVSYAIEEGPDGGRLVYREYPWPDKDFFGEHRARREEVVPEVAGFTVSVVKRQDEETGGGGETPGEWSPRDLLLPRSVTAEVTLRAEGGGEARSFRIAVALPTQAAQ